MLPNGPEAAVVAIAVSAHAVSLPLNPTLSAAELAFELARANLDAIVLPSWIDLSATTLAQARAIGIFHASAATRSLADIGLEPIIGVPSARRRSGAPTHHSVSVIQMSSGSTGTPKLILVSHANLFDIADKMRTWFGLSAIDRCACVLPVYSGFGFKIALVAPLLIGGSVALAKKQQPEDIAAWISDLDPTWFVATPPYLHAALDQLRSSADGKVVHSLRFFASTSAYLPEAVRTGLEASLGIPGLEFYGLREAGIVAANPAPPATRKPSSVGLISSDVAILNSDREILPPGEAGTIAVRGPGVSPGYIDALPAGCDTVPGSDMSANEWKLTGDLGVVDADGFLTIVGRMKEIINRGGEKISPYEVEKALLQHPAVHEAGAFAVPHPRLGEIVAAAVVLQPDIEATGTELRDFLRARLAAIKVPRHIDIVTSIPRNNTGKISRTLLAQMTANHERQIEIPKHPLEFQIMDIWQRLLQRSDIGIHDDFFEAGGDSLLATQMLLEVEAVVGGRVPQSALAEASTIRQLATSATNGFGPEELVTKAKEGAGTPFFFCHGDFATRGFYALRLAALLDTNQPVYLIQPPNDDDSSELVIEDMAQLRVPRLLELQPHGKFRLGGYCNGGLLAWEIAHQLHKAGREVESVVLIDTLSLNSRRVFRLLRRLLYGTAAMTPKVSKRYLRADGMRVAWNLARRSGGSTFGWMPHAIPPLYRRLMPRKDKTIQLESLFDRIRCTTPSCDGQLHPPEDRLRGHCDLLRTACEYFRVVDRALGPAGAQCASHHCSWPTHNLYYNSRRSACTNIERGDRKIRGVHSGIAGDNHLKPAGRALCLQNLSM